jgi:REP element-mobilizing transposase RayT
MQEAADRADIDIVAMSFPLDHAHLLLLLKAGQDIPWAVNRLKGAVARQLFLLIPELKFDMKTDSLWQRGYGARFVPEAQVDTVRKYIATQFERPYGRDPFDKRYVP